MMPQTKMRATVAAAWGWSRIVEIDAIRGVALAGVVLENLFEIPFFFAPDGFLAALPTAGIDRVVGLLVQWLIVEKAQFIFGVLFGLGFAIFLDRERTSGRPPWKLFARRVVALFAFGVLNLFLVFFGDILHLYAVVAILVPVAVLLPESALLVIGVSLLCLNKAIADIVSIWAYGFDLNRFNQTHFPQLADDVWKLFMSRDYELISRAGMHFVEMFDLSSRGVQRLLYVSGQFFVGFWICRSGTLGACLERPHILRRIAVYAIPVGLSISATDLYIDAYDLFPADSYWLWLFHLIGVVITAFGYCSLVAMLAARVSTSMRLLALYGRTALTHYLIQCALLIVLLSDLGFGLIRLLGAGGLFITGCAVVVLQAAASVVWLKYFRFGPFEWVWRCLTYARIHRLLLRPASGRQTKS